MLNCKFKVGDHVRTTFSYSIKYDYFEGKVISIDDINLIEIVNNNGNRKFIFEHDLELICIAKPCCKFKLGDKVKTCKAYNNRNFSPFKGVVYNIENSRIWVIDEWCNKEFFTIFDLEYDCDKNKQILDLCEENKNLKDKIKQLQCTVESNNSTESSNAWKISIQNSRLNTIDRKIEKLESNINVLTIFIIIIIVLFILAHIGVI